MSVFADTSFLFALYRQQDNSPLADAYLKRHSHEVGVAALVLWDFRQAARLQVFRLKNDRAKGFSPAEAVRMLAALEGNMKAGMFRVLPVDWPDAFSISERLSALHTMENGHRSLDILHVATTLHLKRKSLLTFDQNQRELAMATGLKVPI